MNRKFQRHVHANNAIVCPRLLQKMNRDGQLKDVAAIVIATQDLSHCERFKKIYEEDMAMKMNDATN